MDSSQETLLKSLKSARVFLQTYVMYFEMPILFIDYLVKSQAVNNDLQLVHLKEEITTTRLHMKEKEVLFHQHNSQVTLLIVCVPPFYLLIDPKIC